MDKRCDHCMHAYPLDKPHDAECRRHAPLATGGLHGPVETIWPRVNGWQWCGDFEGKPLETDAPETPQPQGDCGPASPETPSEMHSHQRMEN